MLRSWMVCLLALVASSVLAQSWSSAYDQGLKNVRSMEWAAARATFKQAASLRPEDVSAPTRLPGPATEQRLWRGGAPYSPNFLAAYAGFKQAAGLTGADERSALLRTVAGEFEALLAKNQTSRETFFFLNQVYTALSDVEKKQALEARYAAAGALSWKVDSEGMLAEDSAAVAATSTPGQTTGSEVIRPGTPGTTPTQQAGGVNPAGPGLVGPVTPLPTKFALIIGNSQTMLKDLEVPFASDDAQQIREALIANAGYPAANVELVVNATSQEIMTRAHALAERMPNDATLFLYFSGVGLNVDGKDFLSGVDAMDAKSQAGMIPKAELYRVFLGKGALIYAFFQAHRPNESGRFFGQEVPMFGRIAQVQATIPGDRVQGLVRAGRTVGIHTDAMIGVLADLRSNRIPIYEFGWQVFYRMRRGDQATTGGGSQQTPTLPVLTLLGADSRF